VSVIPKGVPGSNCRNLRWYNAMLHEQLPRPRSIMAPREHEWERERIRLELEELTGNVRRTLDESRALLSEVEQALNRR
jgi:hypothetical protein